MKPHRQPSSNPSDQLLSSEHSYTLKEVLCWTFGPKIFRIFTYIFGPHNILPICVHSAWPSSLVVFHHRTSVKRVLFECVFCLIHTMFSCQVDSHQLRGWKSPACKNMVTGWSCWEMPEACTCPVFFLAKARIPNSIRTSVDEDFEKRQMAGSFDKIANKCWFKVGRFLERQLALQFQRLYLSLSPSPLFGGVAHLFNAERNYHLQKLLLFTFPSSQSQSITNSSHPIFILNH